MRERDCTAYIKPGWFLWWFLGRNQTDTQTNTQLIRIERKEQKGLEFKNSKPNQKWQLHMTHQLHTTSSMQANGDIHLAFFALTPPTTLEAVEAATLEAVLMLL